MDDDFDAINDAEAWLTKHHDAISECECQKELEFHTYLDSNTGSRTVAIPNTIVRICGSAGLAIANQAIRVLSKNELRALRENAEK